VAAHSAAADRWRIATPKIDIAAVPERNGSGYPAPFDAPCAEHVRPK
jgi:hypothetical protein